METLEYYNKQISNARTEIKNLRQQLATIKHDHLKEMRAIKASLNNLRCSNCSSDGPNLTPVPSSPISSNCITYNPIGYIETMFYNKRGVPRQPTMVANCKGTVVVDTNVFSNPEHALDGLDEFSHMWIIFHFHITENTSTPAKVAPPRLGGERKGVFATRAPVRPCAIGLSLVAIERVQGNKVHFRGVDMVNGTPVLDIKPYIPQYDYPLSDSAVTSQNIPAVTSRNRPPTEGICDVMYGAASMQINPPSIPRQTIGIYSDISDVTSIPPVEFQDIQSPDAPVQSPTSLSPETPSGSELRSALHDNAERGAPDGQERFTPPQLPRVPQDGIRVAPWITNTVTRSYRVTFTDDVNSRLVDLIGDRAESFKSNIQVLLSEDPRSNYVKSRYPDHEYSCVLEDLSISCVFNSDNSICQIVAVRSAEDM